MPVSCIPPASDGSQNHPADTPWQYLHTAHCLHDGWCPGGVFSPRWVPTVLHLPARQFCGGHTPCPAFHLFRSPYAWLRSPLPVCRCRHPADSIRNWLSPDTLPVHPAWQNYGIPKILLAHRAASRSLLFPLISDNGSPRSARRKGPRPDQSPSYNRFPAPHPPNGRWNNPENNSVMRPA